MDDVMRLAGVVRERVKCHAFEDGHAQQADGQSSIWTSEDNGCPSPRLPPHCYPVAVPCGSNLLPGKGRRRLWRQLPDVSAVQTAPLRRWKRWYTAPSATLLPCSSTLRFQPAAWKRPTALMVQLPDAPAVQTAPSAPLETVVYSVLHHAATL
ncbi:uncharacterized protein LOC144133348 [Amblyomma americanum]